MPTTSLFPTSTARTPEGELTFHNIPVTELTKDFGSPLYVYDLDEIRTRAKFFLNAAAEAFSNTTTHVSYAGKAFLCKEVARIVTEAGMYVDTCTMGEMQIALAAGIPGRRLVLHGNNKSDAEIELAVKEGFAKIVIDVPEEAERIAKIARQLGKRARVMLRVTCGIHAGGHEFIATAHEDQKFGVALLPVGADTTIVDSIDTLQDVTPASANALVRENRESEDGLRHDIRYPYDLKATDVSEGDQMLAAAMELVSNGPAIAALQEIAKYQEDLELVGIHSHIGSNIHDADAFIQAAKRMMLLRKTFYATNAYTLPEVDLGGGYSVAYTEREDQMDVEQELTKLGEAVTKVNRTLGMPMPVISFEPGRWVIAPTGVTLYTVGAIKPVALDGSANDSDGNPVQERVYVSVDGGMSDNIRPALYGADYTAVLANRTGNADTELARVVGIHCESGDIVVKEVRLPKDTHRGDVLAVPMTGAYGRSMANNYNQQLIPAVVGVDETGAHLLMRRQTIEDLLDLDVSE